MILSFQNLPTYLNDMAIIQKGYQFLNVKHVYDIPQNTNVKISRK
jgi:hypothetical protein